MSSTNANPSGGKRRKNYYTFAKKVKRNDLVPGVHGFLFTCNNREYDCLREAYNLLNEYDEMASNVKEEKTSDEKTSDIGCDLDKELKELKEKPKRFQQMATKCNNVIFVQAPEDVQPRTFASMLFTEIETHRSHKCRHVLRFIPVLKTCKSSDASIKQALEEVLDRESSDACTYMIVCKVRNNNDFSRTSLIETCAELVKDKKPEWKVNFESPTKVISIDILQKICCISLLENYFHFSKYNPVEFAQKVGRELESKEAKEEAKEETKEEAKEETVIKAEDTVLHNENTD